jgi:hypothetical protein
MKKFIITESERIQILNLYNINEDESKIVSQEEDKWVPISKKIEQKVTVLDPTKYNNKIVFENLGMMMTILEVEGDVITVGMEEEDRRANHARLQSYLGIKGYTFYPIVKLKVDLSSSKKYQYTKLLNDKSLYNNVLNLQKENLGDDFAANFISKRVSDSSTSELEFRNFPSKESPLNASLPAGTVTVTHWYYSNSDSKLSLISPSSGFEASEDDMERLRKTQKQYNKQYKKYKKSQRDIEDEKKQIPVELSSTSNLKDSLSALENKVFRLGNKFYQISKAIASKKVELKKTITLYSDLQKTNMSTEKEKYSGGEYVFYFTCGKSFIYDNSQYKYEDVNYGNNSTQINKNLIEELQDYVCKYL